MLLVPSVDDAVETAVVVIRHRRAHRGAKMRRRHDELAQLRVLFQHCQSQKHCGKEAIVAARLDRSQRLVTGQDTQLLRIGADHANARYANLKVTAIALSVGGSDTTILQKSS